MEQIARVLRHLNEFWGKQPVSSFGPSALKALRKQWVDGKICLGVINNRVGIIKQMFDWGGEEEIIPAEVAMAIKIVKPLKKGQSTAIEYDPVEPVADDVVEKTMPYLKPQEQDMVMVQRRISGRPQDIYNMRPCDIDRSEELWVYIPFTYKTKKKDAAKNRVRKLFIGPRTQKILLPYLDRCKSNPEQFVFTRRSGKQYIGAVFGKAIADACDKAGVPRWSPNQLRHAGGTEVRKKFGLDAAQIALGHAKASTTEIYAKVDEEKAMQVAREIG
jgi:integrase